MYSSFVILLIAAVFTAQLTLCLKAKQRRSKWIIPVLLGLGEAVCITVYALCAVLEQGGKDIYGPVFAAIIYGILLLYLLAATVAAWVVGAFIRFARNRKK